MSEMLIVIGAAILGVCIFYLLYLNGFGIVNTKSALFYMSSPRWGKRRNYIEEKFSSCNGSMKRVIRLSQSKRYQFVFSSNTTKGSVSIEIYGTKKKLIAKLNNQQPCAFISTEKKRNLRVVTKFVKADGECKLTWNEV